MSEGHVATFSHTSHYCRRRSRCRSSQLWPQPSASSKHAAHGSASALPHSNSQGGISTSIPNAARLSVVVKRPLFHNAKSCSRCSRQSRIISSEMWSSLTFQQKCAPQNFTS